MQLMYTANRRPDDAKIIELRRMIFPKFEMLWSDYSKARTIRNVFVRFSQLFYIEIVISRTFCMSARLNSLSDIMTKEKRLVRIR
jgi:hypothetical protein